MITRISSLEEKRRMGHEIEYFHRTQLEEPKYMEMVRATALAVKEECGKRKNPMVVELGAGTGILSEELSKLDVTLYVTEPDEELLVFTKRRIRNVHFVQMKAQDIAELVKLIGKIDVIVSSEVIHHLPYEEKMMCIEKFREALADDGVMIIGDNVVGDCYAFKDGDRVISDTKVIAPQVAESLRTFWTDLFEGEWPQSFQKAYEQQKEGIVECKTSLPHLLHIVTKAGWAVSKLSVLDKRINEVGGYMVLRAEKGKHYPQHIRNYIATYKLKQEIGGLQYDCFLAREDTPRVDLELGVVKDNNYAYQYPSPILEKELANKIKAKIEKYTKEKVEVVLGAGSDQLLERLAYVFSTITHVVPLPAYFSHMEYLERNNAIIADACMDEGKKWNGVLWLTNPHNPTGKVLSSEELEGLVRDALEKKMLVVVDEAYGEFIDVKPFSSSAVNMGENVIVLRSFSKGTAAAGIRVGYLVTKDPVLAEIIRMYLPLFPIAQQSLEEGIKIIDEYEKRTKAIRKMAARRRNYFMDRVKKKDVKYFEPGAITALLWSDRDLYEDLSKKGIAVMSLNNIKGVPKNAIRVTMSEEEDVDEFMRNL